MAGSAMWAVQAAVYTKLTGDVTLMALVSGVYDSPPENQTYPYVILGNGRERRDDTFARAGKQVQLETEVWSIYKGAKQAADIVDRIAEVLDGGTLTVTGFTHIRTVHDESLLAREADGIVRRGVIRTTTFVAEV